MQVINKADYSHCNPHCAPYVKSLVHKSSRSAVVCRVLFVLDRDDEMQIGLQPEEKQQLQGISLEQLLSAFRAESITFSKGSSAYRGVHVCGQKYCAKISTQGKRIGIGYFDSEEDAAHAYDNAARRLHGRYRFAGAATVRLHSAQACAAVHIQAKF